MIPDITIKITYRGRTFIEDCCIDDANNLSIEELKKLIEKSSTRIFENILEYNKNEPS